MHTDFPMLRQAELYNKTEGYRLFMTVSASAYRDDY